MILSIAQIKNIGELFREGLGKALLDEGFDGIFIQRLIDECRNIRFGRSSNKSILGVMNNYVLNTKWLVWEDGGREGFGYRDRPAINLY